jgi:hypothetical protein
VGVDAQREGRIGVPHLAHDVGRVFADHRQDGRERVAQLVGRDTDRQLRLPAFGEQLVGALDDRDDDALARVAAIARLAGRGGEDVVARSADLPAPDLVVVEPVAQDRQQLDGCISETARDRAGSISTAAPRAVRATTPEIRRQTWKRARSLPSAPTATGISA